jgi:hypothetical protein
VSTDQHSQTGIRKLTADSAAVFVSAIAEVSLLFSEREQLSLSWAIATKAKKEVENKKPGSCVVETQCHKDGLLHSLS